MDIVTGIEIKCNMAWFLQIQLSYSKREQTVRLVRGMCKHGFVPSRLLGNIVLRVGEKKKKLLRWSDYKAVDVVQGSAVRANIHKLYIWQPKPIV